MFESLSTRPIGKLDAALAAISMLVVLPDVPGNLWDSLFLPAQAETVSIVPDDMIFVFGGGAVDRSEGTITLQEIFADWRVRCGDSQLGEVCAMSTSPNSNNEAFRIGVVDLQSEPGGLHGLLFFPFGLVLQNGATLEVDDGPISDPRSFRTCLSDGCVLPLVLDAGQVEVWRHGEIVNAYAVSIEGDKVINLKISLDGFKDAYDRLEVLSSRRRKALAASGVP